MSAHPYATFAINPELVLQPQEAKIDRKTGIGASEIASIVGLNPYSSAFDVFLEKTGKAPDRIETDAMRWGKLLEPKIAEEYERISGKKLVLMFNEPVRHPDRPWQICSPDAIHPAERFVFEAKAPGLRQAYRYGPDGSDEIPDEHFLQVQWQESTLDYDAGVLGVLLGGQTFQTHPVPRNKDLEQVLLEKAHAFWFGNVLADIPPEVGATENTAEYIRQKFPQETLGTRRATAEEAQLARDLADAKEVTKAAEEGETKLANALRLAIADHSGLDGPGFRVSWKAAKPSERVDWEALAKELLTSLQWIGTSNSEHAYELRQAAIDFSGQSVLRKWTSLKTGSRRLILNFKGKESA